jgi:hypothetical protein
MTQRSRKLLEAVVSRIKKQRAAREKGERVAIREGHLREFLHEIGLDTRKFKVSHLAEQFGISQLLVESTGERVYILEAGLDLSRLAKTLGITTALGLAPMVANNMANNYYQPSPVGQPASSEVEVPASNPEANIPKSTNPTVDSSVVLPTVEELQKAIEQANSNKEKNKNTKAELRKSNASKIGSFSFKNMIGDTRTVPGQKLNYAYKDIKLDNTSPAFKGLTKEQIDRLILRIQQNNNNIIPFKRSNTFKNPDGSFYFLDSAGQLRHSPSEKYLKYDQDKYGVWKDTDGSQEYDVVQGGDSGDLTSLIFVPEVDDVTGEDKTEKWSTKYGKGTTSEGGKTESKIDEHNKRDNKPLLQIKTDANGEFEGYDYVDNSELDDYDGDVYMLLPNKEGENSYDEISDSFYSFDSMNNYNDLLSKLQWPPNGFQSPLNSSTMAFQSKEKLMPSRQYWSFTDYVNHLDQGTVNRQYFDARGLLGDKDITLDDLKDDLESRKESGGSSSTDQVKGPEKHNQPASKKLPAGHVNYSVSGSKDISGEGTEKPESTNESYTLAELNEAFAAAGYDTRKFRVEYLAEQLGFVRISEAERPRGQYREARKDEDGNIVHDLYLDGEVVFTSRNKADIHNLLWDKEGKGLTNMEVRAKIEAAKKKSGR